MDKVESVKEWRWKDGYKLQNVHELSDMLEAMKPGDVAYFRAFDVGYDYKVRIRLIKDGYYEVSTKYLSVCFNSWKIVGTTILEPYCEGMRLSAYMTVYVWVLEEKYNSSCDNLISRVYDEMGD